MNKKYLKLIFLTFSLFTQGFAMDVVRTYHAKRQKDYNDTPNQTSIPSYTYTIYKTLSDQRRVSDRSASWFEKKQILQSVIASALIHGNTLNSFADLSAHGLGAENRDKFKHFEILRYTQEFSQRIGENAMAAGQDRPLFDLINTSILDLNDFETFSLYSGIDQERFINWFAEVYSGHVNGLRQPDGKHWHKPESYRGSITLLDRPAPEPQVIAQTDAELPTYDNGAIQGDLFAILQNFYDYHKQRDYENAVLSSLQLIDVFSKIDTDETKANLEFWKKHLLELKSKTYKYSFARNISKSDMINKQKLLSQLHVTIPIDDVYSVYERFHVVQLRPLAHDTLILSCGNIPTEARWAGKSESRKRHAHADADTVDSDVGMSPTVVANLEDSGFFDYLESIGKKYQHIKTEAGYELHGNNGIKKLKKILDINGIYTASHIFVSFINKERTNYPYEDDDSQLTIVLDSNEYKEFLEFKRSNDIESIKDLINTKMRELYEREGFSMKLDQFNLTINPKQIDEKMFVSMQLDKGTSSSFELKRER
jgi:hypothetical protein